MSIPLFHVDAFTADPYKGNPAAVCLLPSPRDAGWMQPVAREMNLSETAFIVPHNDGDFSIRWYTPTVEVALCGHATLASAHVLWEAGRVPAGRPITFQSKSGPLGAQKSGQWIELNFPAMIDQQVEPPASLSAALGVSPVYAGRNADDYIVLVESERMVRELKPDIAALRHIDARGVIVTARAETAGFDFVSRFFAPAVGVDEDPVTGSAHCCLGPFWQARLRKNELMAYQASSRGGVVRVRVAGDRVMIGGQAVTIVKGELAG